MSKRLTLPDRRVLVGSVVIALLVLQTLWGGAPLATQAGPAQVPAPPHAPSASISVTTTGDTLDAAGGQLRRHHHRLAARPRRRHQPARGDLRRQQHRRQRHDHLLRQRHITPSPAPASTKTPTPPATSTCSPTSPSPATARATPSLTAITPTGCWISIRSRAAAAPSAISGVTIQHGSVNPAAINLGGGRRRRPHRDCVDQQQHHHH